MPPLKTELTERLQCEADAIKSEADQKNDAYTRLEAEFWQLDAQWREKSWELFSAMFPDLHYQAQQALLMERKANEAKLKAKEAVNDALAKCGMKLPSGYWDQF